MVPTLFLVTIIVFGVVRIIPGDVVELMVSQMGEEAPMAEELDVEAIRERLGLNVPIHIQYGRWMRALFQGDMGSSLWTGRAVTTSLSERIPVSFELGFFSLVIGILVAIPIGTYSAVRQDTAGDYLGRSVAILALALPNFWVATMIIVFPSIWFGWSPPVEFIPFVKNPVGNLGQFILPACIMGMHMSGGTMRMTRTMMLEVLRQDYIRTAWSKGLRERVIIVRHALKNALIPVVTQIGMRVPILIAGGIIMEQIFCLPGVGNLLIQAIYSRDYPIISGVNLMIASFILIVNLLVDLTYGYLDPRIHYR